MKLKVIFVMACLAAALASCKKNNEKPPQHVSSERTVKFVLYSSKDYSGNNSLAGFRLRILDGNTPLWDSVLAPMSLKNIPGAANPIVVLKTVPGNSKVKLSTGFDYTIENVGQSWYYEEFPAGDLLKTVTLDFK